MTFASARLPPIPASVPIGSVIAAPVPAALRRIVVGLYPANQAARLDPLAALRDA